MNVEIAERLAARRKLAGLSQEALAEKLGVSRQAVSKWERSESSPDTDNLIALAKLYGVSLDELLYVDESIEDDVAFEAADRAEARGAGASTRRGGATPPPNTACSKRGASTASAARLTASRFQASPSRICSSTRWNTSPCASVFTRTRRTSAASIFSAKNSAISRRASSCGWATPRRTDFAAKCPKSEKFQKISEI